MHILRVTMAEGRTAEQKAALMQRLSHAAARHLGAPLAEVRLVIYQVPRAHWGIGGRSLAEEQSGRENRAP
jgi:4-oxalocrotonate tautomerase